MTETTVTTVHHVIGLVSNYSIRICFTAICFSLRNCYLHRPVQKSVLNMLKRCIRMPSPCICVDSQELYHRIYKAPQSLASSIVGSKFFRGYTSILCSVLTKRNGQVQWKPRCTWRHPTQNQEIKFCWRCIWYVPHNKDNDSKFIRETFDTTCHQNILHSTLLNSAFNGCIASKSASAGTGGTAFADRSY